MVHFSLEVKPSPLPKVWRGTGCGPQAGCSMAGEFRMPSFAGFFPCFFTASLSIPSCAGFSGVSQASCGLLQSCFVFLSGRPVWFEMVPPTTAPFCMEEELLWFLKREPAASVGSTRLALLWGAGPSPGRSSQSASGGVCAFPAPCLLPSERNTRGGVGGGRVWSGSSGLAPLQQALPGAERLQ